MNLRDAWGRRSPAEQRVIAGLGIVVAAIALVGLVWWPLERERTRWRAELPVLRASLAQMERQAQEVKRLRSAPPAAPAATSPLASLATNAGGLPGAQVTVMDGRRVRVTGADVSFTALLEWLRAGQATHGIRVESARLDALPAPGRVRVDLVVARS